MIAKNFIRFPEALRFQCELFSNGYHNQPRIMRLMQCIFDWKPEAPSWWKDAKARAKALAKSIRSAIDDFFTLEARPGATPQSGKPGVEYITIINGERKGDSYIVRSREMNHGKTNTWVHCVNGRYFQESYTRQAIGPEVQAAINAQNKLEKRNGVKIPRH